MNDISLPEQLSRSEELKLWLEKYVGKYLASLFVDSATCLRDYFIRCQCGIRFDVINWAPRGMVPTYLARYPEGLPASVPLRELYRRWIRGNKTNNNGDASRFISLVMNLRQLEVEGIQGVFAELGVWKGNSAAILADFAAKSGKRLFLFDTFSGFDQRDFVGIDRDKVVEFADVNIEYVSGTVGHSDITTYIQGFFPESITDAVRERSFALAHLDCDLYEPMKAALEFFYPRMPRGAMLVL